MNILSGHSFSRKEDFRREFELGGGCIHVRRSFGESISEEEMGTSGEESPRNISPPYFVFTEDDSFGFGDRQVVCRRCYEKEKEKEMKKIVRCRDCHKPFEKKDTWEWRWYDFYAPQGDEPLVLCKPCYGAPRHQDRVKQDRRDREAEFSRYEDRDDGGY